MSKKSGREDAAVVQNKHVSVVQMSRKILEEIVFYRADFVIEDEHSRCRAIGERLLGDEFRRKMKIEVGDEHRVGGTECIESVGRY